MTDITPHFIDFHRFHFFDDDVNILVMPLIYGDVIDAVEWQALFFNSSITVVGLIRSTRALSRMPLPLSAMSTSCSLIAGHRP